MDTSSRTATRNASRLLLAVSLAAAVAACDGGGTTGPARTDSGGGAHAGHAHAAGSHGEHASGAPGDGGAHSISHVKLPEGLVVRGEPAGTRVAECKASAKQGDSVTIVGRIGGSRMPFTHDVAMFTIVDPALKSCSDGAEPDHCKTPWDYCCEDREAMKRSMATIEFVDAGGQPFPFPVRGASGLEPMALVAVTGTVVEKNDAGLMVVRASKVVVK